MNLSDGRWARFRTTIVALIPIAAIGAIFFAGWLSLAAYRNNLFDRIAFVAPAPAQKVMIDDAVGRVRFFQELAVNLIKEGNSASAPAELMQIAVKRAPPNFLVTTSPWKTELAFARYGVLFAVNFPTKFELCQLFIRRLQQEGFRVVLNGQDIDATRPRCGPSNSLAAVVYDGNQPAPK
ncbi:hypothetical protein [Bradyrhizobium sp. dw_411]|uniref:hypothetical protein n=1 Tax=Bradyrhizobium sp. dw_411 TaxID=2720082 RepID=UPI001BCFC6C5|nr:hypothetical protein [Bradyrhizobium sp. dw_411]